MSWHDVKAMLRQVGLRPTRQRMALGWILFGKGDRHLTAEMLYEEASRAKVPVSLATIYNTLHQFTEVGLLRQVAVDGSKAYFDTNATAHHHFFIEGEDEVLDIPGAEVIVGKTPTPPEGYRDRARRRRRAAAPQGLQRPQLEVCDQLAGALCSTSLVDLLVRIGAPQPLLLDLAVETLAAELAPGAIARFQRAQHARLQLAPPPAIRRRHFRKAAPARPSISARPRRCACPTAASDRPSLPRLPSRGCAASSRIRP